MKICEDCQKIYPDNARYCMECGRVLSETSETEGNYPDRQWHFRGGWPLFFITLAGSLLFSWILIVGFGLPVLILGAFLPLFWWSGQKRQ